MRKLHIVVLVDADVLNQKELNIVIENALNHAYEKFPHVKPRFIRRGLYGFVIKNENDHPLNVPSHWTFVSTPVIDQATDSELVARLQDFASRKRLVDNENKLAMVMSHGDHRWLHLNMIPSFKDLPIEVFQIKDD